MHAKNLLWVTLASLTIAVHAREFKAAEGDQSLEAEFVRYNVRNGNVTLRSGVGRNLVVPASKFRKEDVDYFIQQQKAADQKDAITVVIKEDNDRENEKRGQILYKIKNSKLVVNLRNSSGFPFEDLKLDYWVVIERDNKGEEKVEIVSDSKEISTLAASDAMEIEGPTVLLTQGAVSVCTTGCPKVAQRAALIGRDRILGTKIEIHNAAGDLIYSNSSSMRINSMLASKE